MNPSFADSKRDRRRLTSIRDCLTPNQDFIISPHPRCKNLYIATAGSFHGWKFLPVIGSYVVDMLDGKLSQELSQKWAWDRDTTVTTKFMPQREMRDV